MIATIVSRNVCEVLQIPDCLSIDDEDLLKSINAFCSFSKVFDCIYEYVNEQSKKLIQLITKLKSTEKPWFSDYQKHMETKFANIEPFLTDLDELTSSINDSLSRYFFSKFSELCYPNEKITLTSERTQEL